MRGKLIKILKDILGEAPELTVPEVASFGHYSTNVALRLAKKEKKDPGTVAGELIAKIKAKAPAGFFAKIEKAGPGFINFWLDASVLQKRLEEISGDPQRGVGASLRGKTIMVEFTDPNPFKLFHIGHLMSNTIGESLARIYEAAGAKVVRANYQGDIGLHVAKAVWFVITQDKRHGGAGHAAHDWKDLASGKAYAFGNRAYEADEEAKKEIIELNKKLYEKRFDEETKKRYEEGRKASLEYFETIYARLGTKFDRYFFESEVGEEGKQLVLAHKDIFKESDGAIIFPGEQYGLHTRVFINSAGLPTYEAKELGLNKKKFEVEPSLDLSVIVTGNEITGYFKVLLKVLELILPDVARKTRHTPHGMLRLPEGKMSSRTGDVITAEALLDAIKERLKEHASEKSDLDARAREIADEAIAVGAVKYSILRQNPGQDIVFDYEKSLSIHGDSAPYLQYAYARLRSILRNAGKRGDADTGALTSAIELELIRKIDQFGDEVERSAAQAAGNNIAKYLHELATQINRFYESTPILTDENEARKNARLILVETAAAVLQRGLDLLGIGTLEKI